MKTSAERTHKRNPYSHSRTPKPNKKDLNPPRQTGDQFTPQEPRRGIRPSREKEAPVFIESKGV
jgi:hypothetical protein